MRVKHCASSGLHFRQPLRERRIDFLLLSRGHKLALILAVGIPAAMLALKATQTAMAARYGSRLNSEDLRHAIALDPLDAVYDYKLGLIDSYSVDPATLRKAVRSFQKAMELNPRKALYWADLAEVCDTLNDTACSNPAIQQALRLSPMTPQFEWQAGNHYLETGHTHEAFEHFRRLLAMDTTYAQSVFRISLGVSGNPETVYQEVVPQDAGPRLKLAFLDFLVSRGDVDSANLVWQQLSSKGFSCKLADVVPYLDRLLSADDIHQATKVWSTLEKSAAIAGPADKGRGNLVYNGGFERGPLNAGLGWHGPNTPYVETDFRDPSAYQGSRCLRVDYAAGQNLESEPVYQLIPVEPNQPYQLRAYVRSDDITSQSGPRLRVVDPECPGCLNVSTVTTVGTTPWHLLTLDFTTGPKTQVIRLAVWRPRCWTFPMEISGSFWVDDVSIEAVSSTPKEAASIH